MIKLAICDDDQKFMQELEQRICLHWEDKGEKLSIASFSNPQILMASVEDGQRFDAYFLDIEMPELDGLALSRVIRTFQPKAPLVFLTSHMEFSPEGYKVEALRFVSKLAIESTLPEALDVVRSRLQQADEGSLLVQHYNNITRILYRDIQFVQKVRRGVEIHTSGQGVIPDGRGIKELFSALDDPRFIFTDRGCVVNLDFTQKMDRSTITLKTGDVLPVSRPMLPSVREAMIDLWGK